jgi:putative ABC transport system permease protein
MRLFLRLAVQGLGRRPLRAILLSLAVAVGGASLFAATVLHKAIDESVGASLDRLGADLLVAPRNTTVNLTAALLTGEPTSETLPIETVRKLSALPGIEIAAPQRYFSIPGSDPTHGGQEGLIAFDPHRDFTVQPWLTEKLGRPLRRGDLIVGGRRSEQTGATVNLFNRNLTVYGRLGLTGVGPFERCYFASYETISDVATSARASTGRAFASELETDRASAVLLRLRVGAAPEQIRFGLAKLPDVQVIAGNGLSTSVRQALRLTLGGLVGFSGLILLTTPMMVAALYTGLLHEHRRELGLLLAVGMRPRQVVRLILVETTLTTGLGGICGVLCAGAMLLLFERSIGYRFELYQVPFALPDAAFLGVAAAFSALLCCAVGVLGAVVPAWKTSRIEPYSLIRGEGA